MATACGDDPTAPREVRTIEPEPAPAHVTEDRDENSPSRGLPCDVQLAADPPPGIGLCGASTDNYKAAYNADPAAPERRTWLAFHQLLADDELYQPVADTPLTAEQVDLERADGATGTRRASVQVIGGPGEDVAFRTGPQLGLWGVLLTIESVEALEPEPVRIRITIDDPDSNPRTVEVEYRHDPELATAPSDSLEHNGPAGRWHVAGIATATNLELGWE